MAASTPTPILNDADFRKQLSTAPAAGYLLFGEEDYLKSFAVSQARELLGGDPAFACFNEIVLDALDFTPEGLRGALMPLPMMADRKIVLLRGLDFNAMKASELDALCEVLAELDEFDYNTLLIPVASGAIDEGFLPRTPSKLLRRLGQYLTLVRFERCTPAKLSGWCVRHFKHNGVEVSPATVATLIELCGRNMLTLASEIDKISYYVLAHGRGEATAADITAVACTTAEFDAYAFSNALMERNTAKALDILADLKFRRVDPLFILKEVVDTACAMLTVLQRTREGATPAELAKQLGLHEFKITLYRRHATGAGETGVRRMLEAALEADRSLKSSPQGYSALELLICSM